MYVSESALARQYMPHQQCQQPHRQHSSKRRSDIIVHFIRSYLPPTSNSLTPTVHIDRYMLHRIIRKFNMDVVKPGLCVHNIQINIYITIEMKNSEFKHSSRCVSILIYVHSIKRIFVKESICLICRI